MQVPPRHSVSLGTPRDEARSLEDLVQRWKAGHHPRVEDCVCGGEIRTASGSNEDVMAAVQRHQVEPVHIAYDRDHGIPWSEAQRRAAVLDRIGVG